MRGMRRGNGEREGERKREREREGEREREREREIKSHVFLKDNKLFKIENIVLQGDFEST